MTHHPSTAAESFWADRLARSTHAAALNRLLSSQAASAHSTITLTASVIETRVEINLNINEPGQHERGLDVTPPIVKAVTGLRISSQDPRYGTWFTLVARWTAATGLTLQGQDRTEPSWNSTPPASHEYVRDLLLHPRPIATMPPWLAAHASGHSSN